jgi:hypothetical protein
MMNRNSDSAAPNPRRPPAHLSVSLRHDRKSAESRANNAQPSFGKMVLQADRADWPSTGQTSDNSSISSNSSGVNHWFEMSNRRAGLAIDHALADGETHFVCPS